MLLAISNNFKEIALWFKSLAHELRADPRQKSWFFPVLFVALLNSLSSEHLNKIGLPIPFLNSSSSLYGYKPKLYPNELLILWLSFLAIKKILSSGFFFQRTNTFEWRALLPYLILIFMVFGAFRIFLDIGKSPVFVLRNSCFVWYFSISLLLAFLGPKLSLLAKVFEACFVSVLVHLVLSLLLALFGLTGHYLPQWNVFIGPYYFIWEALGSGSVLSAGAFSIVAFAMGVASHERLQRTYFLGAFVFLVALALEKFPIHKRILKRTGLVFAVAIVLGYLSVPISRATVSAIHLVYMEFTQEGANSLSKGATTAAPNNWNELIGQTVESIQIENLEAFKPKGEQLDNGLEKFRIFMWQDAARLFLRHPLAGIGFYQQVVYRIYIGTNVFYNNVGGSDGIPSPPVAGPHNSYLNVFARLGILGGLLLVGILFIAYFVIWENKLYAIGIGFFGQLWYALFNVGLESPSRSFLIYLAVAAALVLVTGQTKTSDVPGAQDRS